MAEYIRVLAYPKFKLSEEKINYIIHQEILPFSKVVKSVSGPAIITKDPDDDKFIQCAEAGNAKIIISGDQHLLSLKSHHGISILTLAQFFKKFQLDFELRLTIHRRIIGREEKENISKRIDIQVV
jgi:predicted nucleic acid-binding protein